MGRIITITPGPTDLVTTNGSALIAAVDAAGATASFSNPYLIKLGPGIYDVGSSGVSMAQYVDIEGSGENTTTIQGSVDSATKGVVNGASFAELRLLTVIRYGSGTNAKGIYISGSFPKITSVTVTVDGGSSVTTGIEINGGAPELTHVKVRSNTTGATSTARGIDINGSAFPILEDVDVMAWNGTAESSGIYISGSQPRIFGGSIEVQGGGQGSLHLLLQRRQFPRCQLQCDAVGLL
jgi:hypothetical protein